MKTHPIHPKQLLLYVETTEWNKGELSEEEIRSIRDAIHRDPALQDEVNKISSHLQWINRMPQPAVPDHLAQRCLEAVHRSNSSRLAGWWNLHLWAPAVTLIMLVFTAGVWFGSQHQQDTLPAFDLLLQTQAQYISRLETGLAQRYQQPVLTADNPWYAQIDYLKQSSRAIADASKKYSTDPVIQRGLSLAVAQNISVLQSLCEYVEQNREIPDADMAIIDTTKLDLDSSI